MAEAANQPLMPPPPGETPDFDGESDRQRAIVAVFAVTFTLATIATVLRFYTRVYILKVVSLDEGA